MTCPSCGNNEAYRLSFSPSSVGCDSCSKTNNFKFSDVYFRKPYFDPMLADPDRAPHGQFVDSREHKANIMKQLGIRESA